MNITLERFDSFEAAQKRAAELTEKSGVEHIATDAGPYHYPQYGVIDAPQVGEKVSYAFNGDYHPCGEIISVSKTKKVVRTDTGEIFYRRRLSGCWKRKGGTWSLVRGHIERRNPSF